MRRVYRAPGRVNLIGEHTDYNDGFVMPVAIDRRTLVASEPRYDRRLVVRSDAFADQVSIDLDAPGGPPTGHWSDYVRGVAAVLERAGHRLIGANLEIHSNVPIGAGLSSSAALEVAVGSALVGESGLAIDPTDLARACQQAEHEFAGTRCGLMDQFIACHAREGHALLLDTRTLEADWLPLDAAVAIVVCNTMVRHAHASGEYNERRGDCEEGVRVLAAAAPGVKALRDVTPAMLETYRDRLSPRVYRRCRHVVTENKRVALAAQALRQDDVAAFGSLMGSSHRSLRDDYEVSCPELDTLVEIASRAGVIGARMTGGGFGGCTVNLVEAGAVDAFRAQVAAEHERQTGTRPDIYVCASSNGVGVS